MSCVRWSVFFCVLSFSIDDGCNRANDPLHRSSVGDRSSVEARFINFPFLRARNFSVLITGETRIYLFLISISCFSRFERLLLRFTLDETDCKRVSPFN